MLSEISFCIDFCKVSSGIYPLLFAFCINIDNAKMKVFASRSCACIACYSKFLTCIDGIANLHINLRKVHVLHSGFSSVFTTVFDGDGFSTSCIGAVVDTDNLATIFRCKDIIVSCVDVYTMMNLRFPFVHRVFTLAICRSHKNCLCLLNRHTVFAIREIHTCRFTS